MANVAIMDKIKNNNLFIKNYLEVLKKYIALWKEFINLDCLGTHPLQSPG